MPPNKLLTLGTVVAVAAAAGVLLLAGRDDQPRASADTENTYEKPSHEALRRRLTPEQYHVTQENGTEPPFRNAYWNNKEPGIYVDVVSGEPLFSSLDQFSSGTGWPSFTRPLEEANIVLRNELWLGIGRVEARSRHGDSHLGHVFEDGPPPTGLRYCINSASLRFIPANRVATEGYGQYSELFSTSKGKGEDDLEVAMLAGGCFWGMEDILRHIPGVVDTEVGYTGGTVERPRYGDVKKGMTGHAEAVRVVFNPQRLSYESLLGYFFRMHDPTTLNRQGNDIGTQYRSAIFVYDERQRQIAERIKKEVDVSGKWPDPLVTEIVQAGPFYRAEDYHQDYLQKNPGGYTCHWLRD